ncbi:MAG TPA: hypothetical protein PK228_14585 [Saprospiraceae bacterium]|nr:hypothetical protein [Saprospiraceae bacterium]
MSLGLRSWLFAITVLLLAEDFQYLLKIEGRAFEIIKIEKMAGCEDCQDNEEGTEEKEKKEEKKEDKKEKDDDNSVDVDNLLDAGSLLTQNKFHDVLAPLSAIAHDLESPPPEV